MPPITNLVSFWALVSLVVFLVSQAIPVFGLLVMMFGVLGLSAILVHGLLIALFVEAIMRRLPRLMALIPVAVYGAYYAAYLYQGIDIDRTSAALRASNPGKLLDFDAASRSLVTAQAFATVRDYAISVAYEADASRSFSFRLIPRDQCNRVRREEPARIVITYMHSLCVVRLPEVPPLKIVRVIQYGNRAESPKWGVSRQTYELVVDDVVRGTFTTASIWRLPAVPVNFVIGCMPSMQSSAFNCGIEFVQTLTDIDVIPDSVDRQRYDSPVSIMLGLRKYTQSDLTTFSGYAQNAAVIAAISRESESSAPTPPAR